MKYETLRNKELLALALEIKNLKKQKLDRQLEIQKECSHDQVAYHEYIKFHSDNCMAPRYLCFNCGLEVDDWGNDYANTELFKDKIKITMSSDELYRLRY